MMTDEEITRILNALHRIDIKVTNIETGLYGHSGTADNGLCGDVKRLQTRQEKIIIILAAIIGTALLGTGLWQLL